MENEYSFTPRQTVLIDRLRRLCELAEIDDYFPQRITEIRGGGSLFRLEPSPNDADLSITYVDSESGAAMSFNRVFIEFDDFARGKNYPQTPSQLYSNFANKSELDEARKYQDIYSNWLANCSWSALDRAQDHVFLRDENLKWFEKPVCYALANLMTRRLVRANLPRLQIAELTQRSSVGMKMKLTTIWTPDMPFDPLTIVAASSSHCNEDETSLIPDYHRNLNASTLLEMAISKAMKLRNGDSRSWPKQIEQLRNEAWKILQESEDDTTQVSLTTAEIRKTLKAIRKYFDFQQELLKEIINYKTSPHSRRWGLDNRNISLEQYLATFMFGRMGKSRTRAWLKFTEQLGLDLAPLVHAEQIRLKGRSEVPERYLENKPGNS